MWWLQSFLHDWISLPLLQHSRAGSTSQQCPCQTRCWFSPGRAAEHTHQGTYSSPSTLRVKEAKHSSTKKAMAWKSFCIQLLQSLPSVSVPHLEEINKILILLSHKVKGENGDGEPRSESLLLTCTHSSSHSKSAVPTSGLPGATNINSNSNLCLYWGNILLLCQEVNEKKNDFHTVSKELYQMAFPHISCYQLWAPGAICCNLGKDASFLVLLGFFSGTPSTRQ